MRRGEHDHAGPDPDPRTDRDAAGAVQKTHLPDPGLIADLHRVLVVALQDSAMADIDVAAELDVLRVEDQHVPFEDAVIATRSELLGREFAAAVAAMAHTGSYQTTF